MDIKTVSSMMADRQHCLLGVSGGLDSMAMLHWFARHQNLLPCPVRAMHVDHQVHPCSHEWAKSVYDTCVDLGIDVEIKKVSLDGLGNNLEYAARKARYQAFCNSGSDGLILAHHANDQCENFLLKLFRGSGLKGLKAMRPNMPCWLNSELVVIRPMLGVTREQIEQWAEINHVCKVEDPSNSDDRYDRNYVRNRIWPVINQRFEIADLNTVRSIQHLNEAWELTTMLADQDLALVQMPGGQLDWLKLRDLGYLRIKNVIMRLLDLHLVYGFSINHIEQFAQGLLSADMDSRNEMTLKGFYMQKIGKRIHVGKDQQRAA